MGLSLRKLVKRKALPLILVAVAVASLLPPAILAAQETKPYPRIGLVLSGGGARGAAHVGVIRALEEMHVPIYCIVGTSMGSIVGGLYASGVSVDDLEQIAVKTDWDGLFSDEIPRQNVNYREKSDTSNYVTSLSLDYEKGINIPQGLVTGKRLDLMLRSLTLNAPKDFDMFPIPYRAIASDIETGNCVVLSKGDLARSLRASMAIPGAFAPVEIDGKLLVDGGVANNLAVDVARQMGADVVIAVNIGTPLSTRKDLGNFLGILDQITNILTNRNVEAQLRILGKDDTLLTPELGAITTASFEKMGEAIQIGEKTARDNQAALSRYGVSEDEYRAKRSEQLKKVRPLGKIEFVKMEEKAVPGSDLFLGIVTKGADTILKKDVMSYDIFEFYKRGDFEDIDFSLIEEDGKQGLLIKTKKKEKTEHVVDIGIEVAGTAQKDSSVKLLARYTAANLNRLNAEWKNELWLGQESRFFTEFYQPFNPSPWRFFLAPNFEYRNFPVKLYQSYEDDTSLAEYRVKGYDAGLDFGLQMGEYGEARFGYVSGKTKSSLETGLSFFPEEDITNGAYRISLYVDQLDSPFFPARGGFFSSKYLYGRDKLGSDEDYRSVDSRAVMPVSFGGHTLLLRGRWATNFDSSDNLARGFFLGGLFNLSGLVPNQVFGRDLALGELIYMAKLMKLSPLAGRNMYAGVSFEAGNTWLKRSDINTNDLIYAGSVFLGIDSNIGPIYIALGHAEGGQSAVYFSLGTDIFK